MYKRQLYKSTALVFIIHINDLKVIVTFKPSKGNITCSKGINMETRVDILQDFDHKGVVARDKPNLRAFVVLKEIGSHYKSAQPYV